MSAITPPREPNGEFKSYAHGDPGTDDATMAPATPTAGQIGWSNGELARSLPTVTTSELKADLMHLDSPVGERLTEKIETSHIVDEDLEVSLKALVPGPYMQRTVEAVKNAKTEDEANLAYGQFVAFVGTRAETRADHRNRTEALVDTDGDKYSLGTNRDGMPSGTKYYEDCSTCAGEKAKGNGHFPPHKASSRCTNPNPTNHCTDATCF